MSPRLMSIMVVLVLALMVLGNSFFIVKETERGVLKRFGEVTRADIKPGFYPKLPFVHKVQKFDSRVMVFDTPPEKFLTAEKKNLLVDAFVMWRIDNVEKFLISTGGENWRAENLIKPRVNEGLRNQFSSRSVKEVVSGEREKLMNEVALAVDKLTREELGVEIVDVRVKKIELPENVLNSVYERMRAEREREAREHRSRGKEEAEKIMADADRQRTVLLAEAYSSAEKTRGEGDAQAAAIYANAYNRDPEFYRFYRSLNAYRNTFSSKDDVLVVEPDNEFFDFMKQSAQKR